MRDACLGGWTGMVAHAWVEVNAVCRQRVVIKGYLSIVRDNTGVLNPCVPIHPRE